jgi:hypothetical protein
MAATGRVDHPMLSVRAMGRVFTSTEDIKGLYSLLETKSQHSRLKLYDRYALKELLLYREDAAVCLTPHQALIFAEDAIGQIAEANRTDRYERLFSNALAVIGALLRYRVVDPSFLIPGSSNQVRRIREELEAAIEHLSGPLRDSRKRAWRLRMRELVKEIRNFLDQRGMNRRVLVEIRNEEEGDGVGAEDDGEI